MDIRFSSNIGGISKRTGEKEFVRQLLKNLKRYGDTLGLVGESGCGKSTVAKAFLRLLRREIT